MPETVVFWGPPDLDGSPEGTEDSRLLSSWMTKCSDHGVTKIIDGSARVLPAGERTLARPRAAHQAGMEFDTYVDFNGFPRHGSARMTYGWSLDFLRPPVTSVQAREILDRHRPVYHGPYVTTEMSDFAVRHPEFRSLTRSRSYVLEPGQDLYLSAAFPEVRDHQAHLFVEALEVTRADGLQVEFVLGNEDENGVVPYGYEDRTVSEFRAKFGKDPFDLPNNGPEWMQFRADYVTLFLSEVRARMKGSSPQAVLSTTIIAGEPEDYIKVLQDWPAWIERGLLDEFYLWFRTDSDLKAVERQVKHAVEVAAGRVPVIVELSCYHPGSFQDPDTMLTAGKIAVGNGASGIGIYRSHAVQQLNFWPVLEALSKI